MASLASVYFLSCCKPTYGSSFCYYVEHTKFINPDFYTSKSLKKGECQVHGPLQDHCLIGNNSCTDCRAWSSDSEQQRAHFLDVSSGQRCICGPGPVKDAPKIKEVEGTVRVKREVKEEEPLKEKDQVPKGPQVAVVAPSTTKIEPKKEDELMTKSSEYIHKDDEVSLKSPPPPYRSVDKGDVNDDMRKLDCNLSALEDTFHKFICKNRCLIQNLVQCLNFEKQKQKELQGDYCRLRHDNDVLKTKNEYLNMVNNKQIELFKNELNRAICDNKCFYSKKIQELQNEIHLYKEKLQSYKKNEIRYLDAFEHEKKEKTKLKCDVKSLKGKEVKLLKNYVKLLNFIGEVKKTLTSSSENNGGYSLPRSHNAVSSCDTSFQLKGVLRNALNNGIEVTKKKSLNVRDLSILHDAVQDVNQQLCHQNDSCGVNPMSNMTISHLSMVYTSTDHCEEFPSSDSFQNQFQAYETSSNLSMYPSRQMPGDGHHCYC